MRYFTTILAPFDDSPPARAALDVACSLARESGGSITALYVSQPHLYLTGRHVHTLPKDAEAGRAAVAILVEARRRAQETCGLAVEVVTAEGEPVEQILEMARSRGADSIVMGSHGRRSIERVLLGSVAEGVMRASPVPVIVVHAREVGTA